MRLMGHHPAPGSVSCALIGAPCGSNTTPHGAHCQVIIGAHRQWKGQVRYIGPVAFSAHVQVGIELEAPHGVHDGSVDEIRYFRSLPKHGIFVKASRLKSRTVASRKGM